MLDDSGALNLLFPKTDTAHKETKERKLYYIT